MQNLRKEARFPYAGTKNLLLFLWSTLVYLSMKYRVNGMEIPLDRKETAAAKRMVAKFMEEVEKNSKYIFIFHHTDLNASLVPGSIRSYR